MNSKHFHNQCCIFFHENDLHIFLSILHEFGIEQSLGSSISSKPQNQLTRQSFPLTRVLFGEWQTILLAVDHW